MDERTMAWRRWQRARVIVRRVRLGYDREQRKDERWWRSRKLLVKTEQLQTRFYNWVYYAGENARYAQRNEYRLPVRSRHEDWEDGHYVRCLQRYENNRYLAPCYDRCKKPGRTR